MRLLPTALIGPVAAPSSDFVVAPGADVPENPAARASADRQRVDEIREAPSDAHVHAASVPAGGLRGQASASR